MSNWWQGLAPRERGLIGIATLLTVIIVLWQFVFIPTMNARAEARANLDDADRVLARIQESYVLQRAQGAASASSLSASPSNVEDFKAAVTGSAGDIGSGDRTLAGERCDKRSIGL